MPDADQPPEAIWLNDEAINDHFARVRERYAAGSSASSDDSESVPLAQNEMTRDLRRGS